MMVQLTVLIMLLAGVCCLTDMDFRKLTQQVGTALCPFSNFCHFNASDKLENSSVFKPCCRTCSCDDSCYATKTCCPDKAGVAKRYREEMPVGAVCKRSATKLDPSDAYHMDESVPYLIFDACSDNSSDTELNDKCKGINKTELEDYIWVSDKETEHIYQNIHCATCHGVKALVPWRIRTTCFDVIMADFERVTEILLSPRCDIINELPEEFQETIRKYRCYIPDKYSRCNMTGLWGEYDAVTYAACETFDLPFYQDSSGGGPAEIYKNMFCYVCNEGVFWSWLQGICFKSEEDSIRDIGTTFSTLINYETPTDTQKDTTCVMSEVFDSYMQRCRRLYCPFGQAPIHGECQRLLSLTNGVSIYFLFQLDIIWDQTTVDSEYFEKGGNGEGLSSVFNEINDRLMLNKCSSCFYALCAFKAKTNTSNKTTPISTSELPVVGTGSTDTNATSLEGDTTETLQGVLLSMQFITTTDCQFDFIVERGFTVLDEEITISLNNDEHITFSASLRDVNQTVHPTHDYTDCFGEKFQLSKTILKICDRVEVIITKKPCPEYHLEYSEVISLPRSTKKTTLSHFFDTQKELDETTVVNVCVDEYNESMYLKNESGIFPVPIVELTFIVLILVM